MKKFRLRPTGRRHEMPIFGQIPIHLLEEATINDTISIKTRSMVEYEIRVYMPETQNPEVFVLEPDFGEKHACAADCEVPDNLIVYRCECKGQDEFCDNCHGIGYTVEDRNEVLNKHFDPDPEIVKLLPRK